MIALLPPSPAADCASSAAAEPPLNAALLQAHLPLIRSVVERMKLSLPPHIESEELYSSGVLGLMLAARAYRPEHGASFTSYASARIRGTILDELRKLDWMPRRTRGKAKELREAVNALEQRLGRVPTDAEVAAALSLSAAEYAKLLEAVRPISRVELDGAASSDDANDTPMHDLVADVQQETAATLLERKELVALMNARIQQLPEIPRKVLGFYYQDEMRLAEIGRIFGVTESRICQIHAQAVQTLRSHLNSALGGNEFAGSVSSRRKRPSRHRDQSGTRRAC